ncbi:hypothetical protein FPV67DRAFT_1224149 [Lyophyllum atratum]|nr:hypothetical protein FPV67DRAFT_1224149 [Lyophyllum atratum]
MNQPHTSITWQPEYASERVFLWIQLFLAGLSFCNGRVTNQPMAQNPSRPTEKLFFCSYRRITERPSECFQTQIMRRLLLDGHLITTSQRRACTSSGVNILSMLLFYSPPMSPSLLFHQTTRQTMLMSRALLVLLHNLQAMYQR